jgi:YHS domain-containing protein
VPAVPPGQPIAPGIATGNKYPQWGVGGGTPGNAAGWKVVEAKTAAQKTTYAGQGYLVWFSSQADAKAFVSEESSPVASGEPQNAIPGLTQIGDFFGALGQANTWIRVAKVVAGGALLIIGIAHITGAANAAASVARKVPLPI